MKGNGIMEEWNAGIMECWINGINPKFPRLFEKEGKFYFFIQ